MYSHLRRAAPLAALLTLALVGCPKFGTPSDIPCSADDNCPDGMSCSSGVCVSGGGTTGGTSDSGNFDAGNMDAGHADAGHADSGNMDAGNMDAGSDAGNMDAGFDAGNLDAGNMDAGSDAGNMDAGMDAGFDAGLVITLLSPDNAVVASPMMSLTITGRGFDGTAKIHFGASTIMPGTITTTTVVGQLGGPQLNTLGVFPVNVTTNTATSNVLNFTVGNKVPTVTSASPSPLPSLADVDGGINIVGTNFLADSGVDLDGVGLTVTRQTPTLLVAAASAAQVGDARLGATLHVSNAAPGGGSAQLSIDVLNPLPVLNAVQPARIDLGSADTVVSCVGTGFRPSSVVNLTVLDAGFAAIDAGPPDSGNDIDGGGSIDGGTTSSDAGSTDAGSIVDGGTDGGSSWPTTFGDAGYLEITLPTAMLQNLSLYGISVTTPGPGGGTSATLDVSVLPPQPLIVSTNPVGATSQDPTFTLVVSGQNFDPTVVLDWNGAPLPTTVDDAGMLEVSVDTSLVATAQIVSLTAVSMTPAGSSPPYTFDVNNPLPTLTQLSPSSVVKHAPDTTITLTGTNFRPDSVARATGAAIATTYISNTTMTAVLPSALLRNPVSIPITVFAPGPGGGTSNSLNFTVTP